MGISAICYRVICYLLAICRKKTTTPPPKALTDLAKIPDFRRRGKDFPGHPLFHTCSLFDRHLKPKEALFAPPKKVQEKRLEVLSALSFCHCR